MNISLEDLKRMCLHHEKVGELNGFFLAQHALEKAGLLDEKILETLTSAAYLKLKEILNPAPRP